MAACPRGQQPLRPPGAAGGILPLGAPPRSRPAEAGVLTAVPFIFRSLQLQGLHRQPWGVSTPELGKISDLAHQESGQGGPSLRSLQGQALAPGAWLWAASRPPLSSDPRGSRGLPTAPRSHQPGCRESLRETTQGKQGQRPTSMLALVPRGIHVTCINSSQSLYS